MPAVVVILGPADERSKARFGECKKVADRFPEVELRLVDSEQDADGIVAQCMDAIAILPERTGALTPEIVERLPNLKLAQTFGAGTDRLDKTALAELGVVVANNGGANAVAVAEHAMTLILTMNRKFDAQIESVKKGTYSQGVQGERHEFHTLVGKRVGIVGLGRIGSRVAKRLRGFECEVVYHDVAEFDADYEAAAGARRVDFDELLETSDIVTLHVPLERTTRGLVGEREFRLMKPTAILVNTGRGPVVDETALIRALESGEIFAAGLDVTEIEPIEADNPLPNMPNVVVTPHMAGRAIESEYNAAENTIANAARVARGEQPEWIVPPV